MQKRFLVFSSFFGFLFVASAWANVSLKNGNFFIGYTDIIYPGGFEPKIERVYNSKTMFKGIYGWGWGNEYEVYLTVSADGSVVVHEYGGGAENRFIPTAFSVAEVDKAVAAITAVAQKVGVAGSAAQLEGYKKRLKSDATFRNDEWEKYRAQGKIEARKLPNGAQLHSNRFSYQYITKVADGYVRTYEAGKIEKFDDSGRLVKLSDKNGNFITFTYGKDGHIQKLIDNFNRKIFFEFNAEGFLSKLEGENSKKAVFTYNALGELISSRDVDNNVFTYKYDSQGRHNLIGIGYSDHTEMVISYYGRELFEHVKSIKDRDGLLTEYGYGKEPPDSPHTMASVTVKGKDGKQISKASYEYFTGKKADGESWTQKMITDLDGDRTETTYNELAGLPISIKHGTEETTFQYDQKGRVILKKSSTEFTRLEYDSRAGKVSKVTKTFPGSKQTAWSTFTYDDKTNLILAKNSEGKAVKLFYDNAGRIRTFIDQDQNQISFKYDSNSKPTEISNPKLGTITVEYTNSGEIKKVESTAGRKIAVQVTTSFQGLLDILRPAGVTLSF